jgi:hypothetical protein
MRFFYIVQKFGNDNFFSFQVGLNFLIKSCLILRFENFLTIFKFFSLLQINIFIMFLYYVFKKNMLRLCLVVTPNPRNFITFNFFSLLQNNIFFMFLYYFLNNSFKKNIYWDYVWLRGEIQEIEKKIIFCFTSN